MAMRICVWLLMWVWVLAYMSDDDMGAYIGVDVDRNVYVDADMSGNANVTVYEDVDGNA